MPSKLLSATYLFSNEYGEVTLEFHENSVKVESSLFPLGTKYTEEHQQSMVNNLVLEAVNFALANRGQYA